MPARSGRKARVDIQQEGADHRIDIAASDPRMSEQVEGLRWVGIPDSDTVADRSSRGRRTAPSLKDDHGRIHALELLIDILWFRLREVLALKAGLLLRDDFLDFRGLLLDLGSGELSLIFNSCGVGMGCK